MKVWSIPAEGGKETVHKSPVRVRLKDNQDFNPLKWELLPYSGAAVLTGSHRIVPRRGGIPGQPDSCKKTFIQEQVVTRCGLDSSFLACVRYRQIIRESRGGPNRCQQVNPGTTIECFSRSHSEDRRAQHTNLKVPT
uniref:Uncharacterized protein n=1 Tax=Timema douglasi TaxID=61478 RepID=A0A7R8VTN2_TIMDO|nr:unnamed protein product [Timema douglasi]